MKDYRLKLEIKNNRLLELCEKTDGSVRATAVASGISYGVISAYINFKASPLNKRWLDWKQTASALAAHFGVVEEDIWPEHMRRARRAHGEIRASREEAALILQVIQPSITEAIAPDDQFQSAEVSARVRRAVARLGDVDAQALRLRFGLDAGGDELTLDETGQQMDGRSRERVRQIEARGLRQLRQPARRRGITAATEGETPDDQRWWRRHAPDDYVTTKQAVKAAGYWDCYYLDARIKRGPQEDGYIRREMRTEGEGVMYRAWQVYRWGDIVDALLAEASARVRRA